MSNINPIKLEITHDNHNRKVTVVGTPEESFIIEQQDEIEKAVVALLAKEYVKRHGNEILDAISPDIIAGQIKKKISDDFWRKHD